MTRAVAAVLGPRRTHDFFCELGLQAYETPLMRGLVRSVASTLYSLFKLAKCQGAVSVRDRVAERRSVTFRLIWAA